MGEQRLQAGPCDICGMTNYPLSQGGPTICPACDCKGIEGGLRAQLAAANRRAAFAETRVTELEGVVYGYADEAHDLCDCRGTPSSVPRAASDESRAFEFLQRIQNEAGLWPGDKRTAREAAEAERIAAEAAERGSE